LEGADLLKIFALKKQRRATGFIQSLARQHRRPMNVRTNPLMRSANAIEIDCHNLPIIFVAMDPYAKRNERRVGANRPTISHLPADVDLRTRKDRQREKQ